MKPEGRKTLAHPFKGGYAFPRTHEPRQGRQKAGASAEVLSSLPGLVPLAPPDPAMNRWAML